MTYTERHLVHLSSTTIPSKTTSAAPAKATFPALSQLGIVGLDSRDTMNCGMPHKEGAELIQQWWWAFPDSSTLSSPVSLVADGTGMKDHPSLWCWTNVRKMKLGVHRSKRRIQNAVKATWQYCLEH